jgi:hypothetical protein
MRAAIRLVAVVVLVLGMAGVVYAIWNGVIAYTLWNLSSPCPSPPWLSFSAPATCEAVEGNAVPRELFDPAPLDLYLPGYSLGGIFAGLGGCALVFVMLALGSAVRKES